MEPLAAGLSRLPVTEGSRIVADLGNSRVKWGRLGDDGKVAEVVAMPIDDETRWEKAWRSWSLAAKKSCWAVASVNPALSQRLSGFLTRAGVSRIEWYRSAAQVPISGAIKRPETAGADRALAVLAARSLNRGRGPGSVVLCGTAVTVESIDSGGVWRGGAITAGLHLMAESLHMLTAQLPRIMPRPGPAAVGDATLPALESGVYWGVVGAIRELLTRQQSSRDDLESTGTPWVIWTGGDAAELAASVDWPGSRVVPDLVLHGIAEIGFATLTAEDRSG